MNILIIFATQFGNTEAIAQSIATGFSKTDKVALVSVDRVTNSDLKNIDLLIVGSPTQGGRPTVRLQEFLNQIPAAGLKNINFAAFDTRFKLTDQNIALQLLMKTIGYAAEKIAVILTHRGGQQILPPEGFIVTGKEGPLAPGELHRAAKHFSIKSIPPFKKIAFF